MRRQRHPLAAEPNGPMRHRAMLPALRDEATIGAVAIRVLES